MLETNCFVPWFYKKIEGTEREELMVKFAQEIEEEKKSKEGSLVFGLIKKEWRKYLYKGGPQDEHNPVIEEKVKQEGGALEIAKIAAEPEGGKNDINVLSV